MDETAVKIYVGAAAGPYNSRTGGIKARVQNLQSEMRNNRSPTVLHCQMAHTAGWRANWAILAAFTTRVDKEMIIVAQTVMIILFGSCPTGSYTTCRPKHLKPFPPNWGLNDIGPLRLDGLASYNRNLDTMDPEERQILLRRHAKNGETTALKARCHRQDRLKKGGPIRVYILQRGGRVERFFITLMTARDGAHIDIVIPLQVGLEYGLQLSRTIDINLDLSARNHYAPFATKAAYNSDARRLGLVFSGIRATGPQKGVKFTHWLQSPMRAAISKAEKLVTFLSGYYVGSAEAVENTTKTPDFVVWSGTAFINVSEPADKTVHQPTPILLGHKAADKQDVCDRNESQSLYEIILQIIKALKRLSMSGKIRVTPSIRLYFNTNTADVIAATISVAVRPVVGVILLSTEPFTVSR